MVGRLRNRFGALAINTYDLTDFILRRIRPNHISNSNLMVTVAYINIFSNFFFASFSWSPRQWNGRIAENKNSKQNYAICAVCHTWGAHQSILHRKQRNAFRIWSDELATLENCAGFLSSCLMRAMHINCMMTDSDRSIEHPRCHWHAIPFHAIALAAFLRECLCHNSVYACCLAVDLRRPTSDSTNFHIFNLHKIQFIVNCFGGSTKVCVVCIVVNSMAEHETNFRYGTWWHANNNRWSLGIVDTVDSDGKTAFRARMCVCVCTFLR